MWNQYSAQVLKKFPPWSQARDSHYKSTTFVRDSNDYEVSHTQEFDISYIHFVTHS